MESSTHHIHFHFPIFSRFPCRIGLELKANLDEITECTSAPELSYSLLYSSHKRLTSYVPTNTIRFMHFPIRRETETNFGCEEELHGAAVVEADR